MSARRAASSSTDRRYPWEWRLSDLPEPAEDAPTVFSTFACGGGSSMGYKRAGYRVLGNCEIDPKIAAVYAANLHPKLSYVEDIRDFNRREDLPDELYELDVLDGSPPCSTFSMQGSREKAWGVEKRFAEGQKMQRLDDLFFAYLETVGKLRPKCFVAENVMGLVAGNARGYVHEIVETAQGMGYSVQVFRLNAAFMGVPQRRERVFFVGNRMGWPKLRLEFSERPVTFGEVRTETGGGRLTVPVECLARQAKPFDGDLGKVTKGKNYSYALAWDERPAPTLHTGRQIRMADLTYMTDADVVRASTFPGDYQFGKSDPQFVCGMSVPPSMMANVAHEVRRQWLEG